MNPGLRQILSQQPNMMMQVQILIIDPHLNLINPSVTRVWK